MDFKNKNVLVLAPHTDDGELGMGGSIARFIEEGADVYYAAFSTCEQSVPENFPKDILTREVKEATAVLGIKPSNLFIFNFEVRRFSYARQEILEEMIRLRKQVDFDLVFAPCLGDVHQDHFTIASEAIRAFKRASIFSYELIWNNISFNSACFIKLEEKHLQKKLEALKAYQSQAFRQYTTEEFIFSWARTRGVQLGVPYAEAFEIVRMII